MEHEMETKGLHGVSKEYVPPITYSFMGQGYYPNSGKSNGKGYGTSNGNRVSPLQTQQSSNWKNATKFELEVRSATKAMNLVQSVKWM